MRNCVFCGVSGPGGNTTKSSVFFSVVFGVFFSIVCCASPHAFTSEMPRILEHRLGRQVNPSGKALKTNGKSIGELVTLETKSPRGGGKPEDPRKAQPSEARPFSSCVFLTSEDTSKEDGERRQQRRFSRGALAKLGFPLSSGLLDLYFF